MSQAHNRFDITGRMERDRLEFEANFKFWLQKPEVKFMVSLIPPASVDHSLETLLQLAFNAGTESGQCQAMRAVAEMVARSLPKEG